MSRKWIEREDHPFDRGYWARCDRKPRRSLSDDEEIRGWDACNQELKLERQSFAEALAVATDQ